MLSSEDNDRLTRVGPGTPMGELMRRYWIPAGFAHHVATPDGQPVTDAVITVDGDMPQHGHGLPTRPQVTKHLGNGDYLVEGLKFQMGGWWVVDFTIDANGKHDTVRFNMILK